MAQENVEIVRAIYDALARGDFNAAIGIVHPEVEFIRPGVKALVRGAAARRAWLEPDAFVDQQWEPKEFRVNGNKDSSSTRRAPALEAAGLSE